MDPLAARGFADVADAYERGRPEYPAAALELAGVRPGMRVLDLAAGTGKLSRALRAAGADVVAVEPLPAMRARLPGALEGTAEAIPLPDASVDAAVMGDAWHWFDHARAGAELARVVRPGGPAAILWQLPSREGRPAWAQAMHDALREVRGRHPFFEQRDQTPALGPGFPVPEHHVVRFDHVDDAEGVLAYVASISYVNTLEPAARERLLTDVRGLIPDGPLVQPFETQVWVSRRRG